jgi:transposase
MGNKSSSVLYVGMDVHKESIDVALAGSTGAVRHYGQIGGERTDLQRVVRKLESLGQSLVFVYEAGPCGFALQRWLSERGHVCWVVSPADTPRRGRDRIKTDRRDALKLAGLARAGELTAIYIPDALDEAMRDLVRAREDAVAVQRQARHRLQALLLRNDIRYVGKCAWTEAHRRWIARLQIPHPTQRIAFEEYVQQVEEATARVARLTQAIEHAVTDWRGLALVQALQACRGIKLIHAARIVAELGEFTRFTHPRQLMAYLGLVPSEYSSGARRFPGAITKAGNRSARRALIEAAWSYRYGARITPTIAVRQSAVTPEIRAIAWKAQLRLSARYRKLKARNLQHNKIVVAIARELAGFLWAIAQRVPLAPVSASSP